MVSIDEIASIPKEEIPAVSETLTPEEIHLLVGLLDEKDDKIRYPALLLLRSRSEKHNDVYPYMDVFIQKLGNPNSFMRSIGVMLIADNVRWDKQDKFSGIFNHYLDIVNDEKPITVRQCIQNLGQIVAARPEFAGRICEKLLDIDISQRKETQQKLVLLDILSVFIITRRIETNEKVERYILNALTGELLDKKSKAEIQQRMAV
ncbi:MAG: hypothetical protein GX577_04005 [Leptolinea sp.]|nr:hypothetical protein [Leptolinea sp.]